MNLKAERDFDVLVVGGGIAGTMAAVQAARQGASVGIFCLGPLFSGSSFYSGTWGLGLVGPASVNDESDLERTILEVGCHAADPDLVHAFVHGIAPAIEFLESIDVVLKKPDHAEQREFIPCFDHKQRLWRGIGRESYRNAVGKELARLDVRVFPQHELLDLVEHEGRIAGALFYDHENACTKLISCASTILATGGYGGLFERRLTAGDVVGTAQAIAAQHGCRLTNLEFMQMMPGIVHPRMGIVFNEKTFRHSVLRDRNGHDPLRRLPDEQAVLECRSGHGPFTSRLVSREVDFAMDSEGSRGISIRYERNEETLPEFVKTYFDWLQEAHGISPSDELRIAPFAHAANGGIAIDENGATGKDGLFACGEATGGMHGADRIGGLASANALVFGLKAGASAAAWASSQTKAPSPLAIAWACRAIPNEQQVTQTLQRTMSESCMIIRSEDLLNHALDTLSNLKKHLDEHAEPTDDPRRAASTTRLDSQIQLATRIVEAALACKESCGSHFRIDDPRWKQRRQA